jgi:pyrophosphatase PpaX
MLVVPGEYYCDSKERSDLTMPQYPVWDAIEAILFDLDGTLIRANNRWPLELAARLAPLKHVFPRLDTEALGRTVFGALEAPANYALSFLEHLRIDTGFWGLTDRLRRSKGLAARGEEAWLGRGRDLVRVLAPQYLLAVVTTRGRKEAVAFVQGAGLADCFAAIVSRQDVWRMKPHPEPVRKAAGLLRVPVGRCLMVGDTTMDMAAARRAGAWAVGVLSGLGEQQELAQAGAHLILQSAEQLLDYLPAIPQAESPRQTPAGEARSAATAPEGG